MKNQNEPNRLDSGHFLGLKFKEGWWFTQVLSVSELELKPWILLNENDNRAEIASQTAGNKDEVRDSVSRRLLEPNDDERDLIFQIHVGIAPSRMQLYPSFGREQNLGLEDNIATGEDEHWVTGYDSPYNNPSEQSEIFYINDMSRLKLQAYNPMDRAEEAKVSFHVNKIHYGTVTDVNMQKALLRNQIRSKKEPVGLGAKEEDQLSAPNWLKRAFGEHIRSTGEIIKKGDSNKAENQMDFRNGAELRTPEQ